MYNLRLCPKPIKQALAWIIKLILPGDTLHYHDFDFDKIEVRLDFKRKVQS